MTDTNDNTKTAQVAKLPDAICSELEAQLLRHLESASEGVRKGNTGWHGREMESAKLLVDLLKEKYRTVVIPYSESVSGATSYTFPSDEDAEDAAIMDAVAGEPSIPIDALLNDSPNAELSREPKGQSHE